MKDKELVAVFTHARMLIESKRCTFICHAIEHCELPGWLMARKLIEKRLSRCYTYESWLEKYHPDFYAHAGNCRPGRLAWLDSLIKEFL